MSPVRSSHLETGVLTPKSCTLSPLLRTISSIARDPDPIALPYHVKRDDLGLIFKMRPMVEGLHLMRCFWKGPTQVKVSEAVRGRKVRKWIWVGLAAFVALQVYFVQEMLA